MSNLTLATYTCRSIGVLSSNPDLQAIKWTFIALYVHWAVYVGLHAFGLNTEVEACHLLLPLYAFGWSALMCT